MDIIIRNDKNMVCGVYCIRNKINNKRYIGKSDCIYDRWCNHIYHLNTNSHKNIHLQNAWNKYGSESFEFYVVEPCASSDDAYEREKIWINYYDSYKNGYNRDLGGSGSLGYKHTEETRRKMSELMQQRVKDFNYVHPLLGKKMSEESKKRISESHKGLLVGQKNHMSIKIICITTNEIFECLSDANKKYHCNLNKRLKNGVCATGRQRTNDLKIWMTYDYYSSLSQKEINNIVDQIIYDRDYRVICLNTGKIYNTPSEAAKEYGIRSQGITWCCRGQSTYYKNDIDGNPLHWAYVKNMNESKGR